MNEVPNNEQIADEARLFENAQLVFEPLGQLWIVYRTFAVTFSQTIVAKFAQIFFARFAGRSRILGILGASKLKIEGTAFASCECARNRFWKISRHLAHSAR